MSTRGQILAYATLTQDRRIGLKEISANCGIGVSTCSNIIQEAKQWALSNNNPDFCDAENLMPRPNTSKDSNQALNPEEKQVLIDLALSDTEHCRMPLEELAREGKDNGTQVAYWD